MRAVVEGDLGAEEAVVAYHDEMTKAGIRSTLPIDKDREITDPVLKT